MLLKQNHVKKSWGRELWFDNNEKYCGKLLYVENDKWSSKGNYHYHKIKLETFFIIEGSLILDYVEDEKFKRKILEKYESFRIEPYMKHRFTANYSEGCKFIEASTTHNDDDSYRVSWDGNQWNPI